MIIKISMKLEQLECLRSDFCQRVHQLQHLYQISSSGVKNGLRNAKNVQVHN